MVDEIEAAKKAQDTLGGVVEVRAFGCPPGLGSYASEDLRLDARIAGAACCGLLSRATGLRRAERISERMRQDAWAAVGKVNGLGLLVELDEPT